ncbi:MAG: outer membrane beta-barrel protein [Pseudomonadota bacterium]
MKNRNLIISLALLAGLAVGGTAQAAGKIYVGGKIGIVDADSGVSGVSLDPAIAAGVYGGYNLLGKDAHFAADLKGGTLAVEGEALLTGVKGDVTPAGDWDITSFGAFAAYRHPLTDYFYLKGKLGLVRYDIDATSGVETTLAAGIGAGWKVGPGSLEAEIATYGNDLRMLSAGFHMNF